MSVSICLSVCLQDHWKLLFLCWWLGVDSEPPTPLQSPPPPPPPSSSSSLSSPPPYSCWEYSVKSSLRFPTSKTSSSCSWTVGWILKERLLEQVFRCKNKKFKNLKIKKKKKKKREQKWKRTHRSGAFRERVPHDICIMANRTLLSKAIKAVSIDQPR